jgi:hypothetical protein
LSEVICNHGLEDWIGIRLLHRHNSLTNGEIMLEAEEQHSTENATLTTMATRLSRIKHQFSPNSWVAEGGRFFPMEYSQDAAIILGPDFPEEYREFFVEFEAVLSAFGVTKLLGPAILRRNFFDKHKPEAPAILVETSDDARRANTVRFVKEGQYDWNTLIQTTWTAINPAAEGDSACQDSHTALSAIRCSPVTGCLKLGFNKHKSSTGHQS